MNLIKLFKERGYLFGQKEINKDDYPLLHDSLKKLSNLETNNENFIVDFKVPDIKNENFFRAN
jgi:hypothetical protein